jgi:hypothetical protein
MRNPDLSFYIPARIISAKLRLIPKFEDATAMTKTGFLTVIVALLAGCVAQPPPQAPAELCLAATDVTTVLQQAEQVLAEMHFEIDKSDAAAGYLRTRPLRGGQFFEFWRKDNVGFFNASESNLQTLRRTVEIAASDRAGNICVVCTVKTERLNMPERQAGVSTAYAMFTASHGRMQRLELTDEQKQRMQWADLGDDTMLAGRILDSIEQKSTIRPTVMNQPSARL